MRSLLFGSIIVALTLADLTPAVARKTRHYSGSQPSYSACVCHWGYAADNSGTPDTKAYIGRPRSQNRWFTQK